MALVKAAVTPQASATQTAGAGDTVSSSQNVTVVYQADLMGKITNGATGPTIGCDFYVQVSNDNSNFLEIYRATAPTTNSGVYTFPFSLTLGGGGGAWLYYRTGFGSNTGQNVTIECDAAHVTSL